MKSIPVVAALLFASSWAHAMPMTWQLLNYDMAVVGTFELDLGTGVTTDVQISGDMSTYTIPSTFTALNTSEFVGPYAVDNYFKFFSTEAGEVYREEYGGGEYSEIRVNDSAMDIGTNGVLVADGRLYDAYINEIYNYDESYVGCSYYEELYDEEGEYIGDGPCASFYSDNYYNIDTGYWYEGFYLRSAPAVVDVPVPATGWLLLAGLAGLGLRRRRKA